jgi:precorrin-6A/cobalt-precorrin-6A reductase
LPDHELVIGMPGNVKDETELLKRHRVTHIVCRNSGGAGAYSKIEAARGSSIPVFIIAQISEMKV